VEPGGAGDDVDDFAPPLATADPIAVDCDAIADLCVHRYLRELAVARVQRPRGVKARTSVSGQVDAPRRETVTTKSCLAGCDSRIANSPRDARRNPHVDTRSSCVPLEVATIAGQVT
jgi:hypothetical protein